MAAPRTPPADHPTARLVGTSPAIVALRAQIQQLVRFDTPGHPAVPTLLLQGETGTGKSLVARVVHDSGPRVSGPFLEVNCAALPETMLEAELFGFEAGAFTDAKRAKPGLFEAAAGGTLFLDEIDAVPLALQGKLLTALETKRVRRLGAVADRVVDVKLIAATNADLGQWVATGQLRADLYHRLAVVVLTLPPLRERGEDVLALAQAQLAQLAAAHGLAPKRLQADAVQWPLPTAALPQDSLAHPAAVAPADRAAPADASPPPVPVPRSPVAERRHLTVLFADLVDSTALASQLDPEEWQGVIQGYHATCAAVMAPGDGYIAQYLGDGVLVYFGYPQAHEDDAQRAVRAGLALVEALQALPPLGDTPPLRVRVGIHTGLVVISAVGAGARQEPLALGETPHLAARLQSIAAPGTVVCSEATARLVAGYVIVDALGGQALKGMATPMQAYRVVGASGAQSRLEATEGQRRTPFVGRDTEVALLRERWAQVQAGQGQVVVLSGEAGIGKSRLVQVAREQVVGTAATQLVWQGVAAHQHSPLAPVITQLQQVLGQEGTPDAQLQQVERLLAPLPRPLPETVPLLAALLALVLPARYPPLALSPQRQREQTLQTLLLWLLHTAERHPVLLVVEDLHWLDPSTLALLSLLIPQVPTARLGVLGTCRPEFTVPWTPRAHLTQVTLGRLLPPQVAQMVTSVAGEKPLPAAVLQQVVNTTDGVPLFVEELTKMMLEADWLQEQAEHYTLTAPLTPLAIPATLHDSLMARLDRLGAAKPLAQLGATLGRQFSYTLLQAVARDDDAALQAALAQLVDAELLYQRGVPPQATYRFKHALIQETAYQSLLRRTRQHYHQQIAQVLEAQFPETVETQPELLAQHYAEAGLPAQAVLYWQRAGQRASERSAHVEALAHLRQGLQLLQTLPETPARRHQEVDLHIALGSSLMATQGPGAPEVAQTYTRARQLCDYLDAPHQLFPVLRGLWNYAVIRAELQPAHTLGQQLLGLAQHSQDPGMLLAAYRAVGTILLHLGEVAAALRHWTQGMALYDPQQHRAYAFVYGEDAGVICHGYAPCALWYLGYPAQGLVRSDEALRLAQQVAHPFTLCHALNTLGQFHQYRRAGFAVQQCAEAAIKVATEQGFPLWTARSGVLRGWALAQQGQTKEGIAQMQQSMYALRATGAELARPYFLVLLAEAYGALGQPEAGLTLLTEALTLTDTRRVRWYEPELYRLKGELLLQRSLENQTEAETCFHHAIDIARNQQARSLELRVATSLARLWQRQGKRDAARQVLGDVYGWFTEGFDTADLQAAKTLLDALA